MIDWSLSSSGSWGCSKWKNMLERYLPSSLRDDDDNMGVILELGYAQLIYLMLFVTMISRQTKVPFMDVKGRVIDRLILLGCSTHPNKASNNPVLWYLETSVNIYYDIMVIYSCGFPDFLGHSMSSFWRLDFPMDINPPASLGSFMTSWNPTYNPGWYTSDSLGLWWFSQVWGVKLPWLVVMTLWESNMAAF